LCSITTGVAVVAQAMQHVEQLLDIREVQAGGRLVEDVQGLAGIALGQLARQLDPLRFAAGQRGGRLPQLDVQAHVHQRLQLARQRNTSKNSRLPRWSSPVSWMFLPLY
jgi:hypothetical protein